MSLVKFAAVVAGAAAVFATSQVMAQAPGPNAGGNGPCQQIKQACLSAGFKSGDWKNGDGLWRDCVDPIIQGKTTVPGGTKTLPTVSANLVSECKAKNPKFGEGKVGSTK